jgi:hypothetical protein
MGEGYNPEILVELGHDWRNLHTKLHQGAAAGDLCSGRTQHLLGCGRTLRHGTLRTHLVLSFQAEHRPKDGVELEDEK